jgi:hypothetical protein
MGDAAKMNGADGAGVADESNWLQSLTSLQSQLNVLNDLLRGIQTVRSQTTSIFTLHETRKSLEELSSFTSTFLNDESQAALQAGYLRENADGSDVDLYRRAITKPPSRVNRCVRWFKLRAS